MKGAHHMGYRLLSGIKNGFILKFSLTLLLDDLDNFFKSSRLRVQNNTKKTSFLEFLRPILLSLGAEGSENKVTLSL